MLPIGLYPPPTIKEPGIVRIAAISRVRIAAIIRLRIVAVTLLRIVAVTRVRIAAVTGVQIVAVIGIRIAAASRSMGSSVRSCSANTISASTSGVGTNRTAHTATRSRGGPAIWLPPDTKNRDLHSPILGMPACGGLATVMNSSRGGRRRTSVYRALIIPNRGIHVPPPDSRCRQRCDQESAAALTAL
jgi:hypothetical protein